MAAWSFAGQNLSNANLSYGTLTSANFTGANLSSARLYYDTLTGATLTNSTITGADFGRTAGFTAQQLYSTASYQAGNLAGIGLEYDNVTAWSFAGQNLSHANLLFAMLTNANLTDTDLRGATYFSLSGTILHNTILTDGTINGLSLVAGETLPVRNNSIVIHVIGTPSFDPASTVQMIFDGNPWGSAISFDPGVAVSLAGELNLTLAAGVNFNSLAGKSFQLFNWNGVTPIGSFNIVSPWGWYSNQLYTTGVVTAALLGDANLDGTVNGADLNIVLSNFNKTGMTWSQGDFVGNGTVNGADLNMLLSNFNQSVTATAAVPNQPLLCFVASVRSACSLTPGADGRVYSSRFRTTVSIHFGTPSAVPACVRQATTRGPTGLGASRCSHRSRPELPWARAALPPPPRSSRPCRSRRHR